MHRPAIAQVAFQDDDEDSRKRNCRPMLKTSTNSPLSGVDRNWGRARVGFRGRYRAVLRAPCGTEKGRYSRITTLTRYQTSPGRHSQLMAACRSRGGVVGVGSTMIPPSSSGVGTRSQFVLTAVDPSHSSQPSRR